MPARSPLWIPCILLLFCMVFFYSPGMSYGEEPVLVVEAADPDAPVLVQPPVLYTVTYLDGNGCPVYAEDIPAGQSIIPPLLDMMMPEGMVFSHWADVLSDGAPFSFATPIGGPVTLRAQFAPVADVSQPQIIGDVLPDEHLKAIHAVAYAIPDAPVDDLAPQILYDQPNPASAPAQGVQVLLKTDLPLTYGKEVTLAGQLTGYDETAISLQWQYLSGGQWHDAPGANERLLTFILDETNSGYQWRLRVTASP